METKQKIDIMNNKLAQVSREIISLQNFLWNKKRSEYVDYFDKLSMSFKTGLDVVEQEIARKKRILDTLFTKTHKLADKKIAEINKNLV
jgi:hypothetical protein